MTGWLVRASGTVLMVLAVVWSGGCAQQDGQAMQATEVVRTADGKPDFSGVWQAMNTANWNIQDHAAERGPVLALGAAFSIPGGRGIVDGNEIPYQPWAAEQKEENARNWLAADPEIKCYLPGTPRAMYMPYPFQITQTPDYILMAFEFSGTTRTVHMNPRPMEEFETQPPSWMGWSVGHWEDDTLVIDATDFNGQAWFDRAGNFHGEGMSLTERYTVVDPNTIQYEVTIDDPDVFTRPWTMNMPLYRRLEPYAEIFEYKCVEFVEDLLYGEFYKDPVVVE